MSELKELPIWVCWNREERDGKTTTVPCSASGSATGTNEKYRNTWVTFDEATSAAQARGFSGVGFIIPKGWFFLDIDHVGIDDPWLIDRVNRFGSYTEYSQSGQGIHIYGKCDFSKLPTREVNGKVKIDDRKYYVKNPKNAMELYVGGLTNRFAVFTGNAVRDVPLAECTDALLQTFETEMLRDELKKDTLVVGESGENFDIVAKLLKQKNGDKFKKLYCDGDYSEYLSNDGKPDESRADFALAAMIAFRTGDDPDAVFSVIKKSALMREKWNRPDYREATIRKAIDSLGGKFHRSVTPHPYFIKVDDNTGQEYVSKPLLARYVREHLHYVLVRDNGKQGLLIYVYEDGVYRLYAPDMLKGVIKNFIAEYDEELIKMNTVNEVFGLITTDLNYVAQDDLNANESLINVENGLLRVTADEITLLPHSPDVYSTIRIPVTWTGQPIPTPVHDRYLETLTNGSAEVQKLLYEFIGTVMSNVKGWRMKKALFLVGPGDTGKSQEKSLVERMLGKGNYIGIDLKGIEARFGTGAVYGTRLAGCSDMGFMSVDELKVFKMLTGGDSLFAEFKGLQAFEFTYNGLLWFCMNKLPRFGGDDGQWVYDRIMVVHCDNVIPKDKQDKTLQDKMYAERDGIFYKAVLALQSVIRNGYRFSEPESVKKARSDYRGENSSVIAFFKECMTERPHPKIEDSCTTGKVYAVYKAWCADNANGYAKPAADFRGQLAEHIGAAPEDLIVHTKRGNFYRNYTLTLEAKSEYVRAYGYDSVAPFTAD
ncbi:MAG: phage/plasmid primase, P4 family [Clostridia bacterium]|nr:phage/plasmid primase, P4 family [Clostridia bacterium]